MACRADVYSPARARAQHLELTEVEALAQRLNARFTAAIAALRPPNSLKDAHTRLLDDLRATPLLPTPAQIVAYGRTLLSDYRANRLSGCAARAQAALSQYLGHPAS
jgi:hypothetical protein